MVADANQNYCGDNFVIDTSFESLCCIPEANMMLFISYTSIKIKKGEAEKELEKGGEW